MHVLLRKLTFLRTSFLCFPNRQILKLPMYVWILIVKWTSANTMSHILFKKRMRHGVSRGPFIRNADYLHPLVSAALSTYAYIYTAYTENGLNVTSCFIQNKLGYLVIKKSKQKEWQHCLSTLCDTIQYWMNHVTVKIVEIVHLFYSIKPWMLLCTFSW